MPTASPFRRALCAVALLLVPAAPLAAQSLAPGTRVRVKSPQVVAPITGSLQAMRRDTLVVIEDDVSARIWSFATPNVERLEVSDGMKGGNRGPMTRWGLTGAAAGAALGWAIAVLLEGATGDDYNDVVSGALGAAVGAGVGTAYGYRKLEEHWTHVAVPRRVGMLPTRGGVRLSYSASF